jgi:hypothetical protein
MAKRSRVSASGRTRAEAAAHRHVEYVQADSGDIEPFRMDTAIAEAVFEVSVAEGANVNAFIAAAVHAHVAGPEAELTRAEAKSRIELLEQQVARYKARLRAEIEAADFADLPHFRVIGRVLRVLTHHRKYPSASGPDIFLVFLAEIPHELEVTHRQAPPGDSPFDPTLRPGLSNIYTRLRRLTGKRYAATTSTTAAGDEQGYVLTEDGVLAFDGWPDIPGLTLLPPPTTRRLPPRTATKRRRAASR